MVLHKKFPTIEPAVVRERKCFETKSGRMLCSLYVGTVVFGGHAKQEIGVTGVKAGSPERYTQPGDNY